MKIMHRIAMSAGVVGVALASTLAPAVAHAAPAPTRGTVIVVPGQLLGPLPYTPLAESLRRDGYRVRLVDLRGTDLRSDARALGRVVDAEHKTRPGTKVSLVGQSVGGLTIRYYTKVLGGAPKVANVIAIGTPEYGTPAGCGQSGTDEMTCPGSSYLRELNAGDDTPGTTKYYRIRSAYEWVTGNLDGGQRRVAPVPAWIAPDGGVEHSLEGANPAVAKAVSRSLAGHCDGEFLTEKDGAISIKNSVRGR